AEFSITIVAPTSQGPGCRLGPCFLMSRSPPVVTYPADQHGKVDAKREHHDRDNNHHEQQIGHDGTLCCRIALLPILRLNFPSLVRDQLGWFWLRAKTAGRILNPCLGSRVCNRSMCCCCCCSAALSADTAHAGGNNCSTSKVQVSAGYFVSALASRGLDGLM